MTTAGEPAIEFMHSDLVREVELMSKLAAPFVTAETHWRFGRIKGELQNLAQGRDLAWEIPLESPLVTELSYGDYEVKQGDKGNTRRRCACQLFVACPRCRLPSSGAYHGKRDHKTHARRCVNRACDGTRDVADGGGRP